MSESTLGEPLEQLDIDGRLYSRSLLNYLRALVFLKRNVDCSGLRSVLEIGGGFGSLGEILLKCPEQGMFYMDVDIPPVAYVATRYLQELFGEASVASYDVTRDWETISLDALRRDFRAAVLCPWQLPRLRGSFDLFANFHSFQEMEPDIVRNYAGCVSPLVSRHLLLRNSGVGKRVASKPGEVGVFEPTLRADYLDAFPDFELVASDSVVYGHHDPRFDSEVMVLERRSPAD